MSRNNVVSVWNFNSVLNAKLVLVISHRIVFLFLFCKRLCQCGRSRSERSERSKEVSLIAGVIVNNEADDDEDEN